MAKGQKPPAKKPNPSENEIATPPPTDKERKEGGVSPAPKPRGYACGGKVKKRKRFAEGGEVEGEGMGVFGNGGSNEGTIKKRSFKEEFAAAKDGSVFTWNGKQYKKEYAKPADKPAAKPAAASGPSTRSSARRGESFGPSTRGVAKRETAPAPAAKKSEPRMGSHNFTEGFGKPFLARFGTSSQRERYKAQGYKSGGSVRGVGCATRGYGKAMKK